MREFLPYISVLLAIVAAGSIAYIAWDLTAEDRHRPDNLPPESGDDQRR